MVGSQSLSHKLRLKLNHSKNLQSNYPEIPSSWLLELTRAETHVSYIRSVVKGEGCLLKYKGLRWLGHTQGFFVSDSRVVGTLSPALALTRMLLRSEQSSSGRTGSNGKNTRRVLMGASPSFFKADGAGAMRTKRSRKEDSPKRYIRVAGGMS